MSDRTASVKRGKPESFGWLLIERLPNIGLDVYEKPNGARAHIPISQNEISVPVDDKNRQILD